MGDRLGRRRLDQHLRYDGWRPGELDGRDARRGTKQFLGRDFFEGRRHDPGRDLVNGELFLGHRWGWRSLVHGDHSPTRGWRGDRGSPGDRDVVERRNVLDERCGWRGHAP